tara:strand:+ start:2678 stop:3694 length:1017 start_codon:yes stop_codon:yes gene_type:complete
MSISNDVLSSTLRILLEEEVDNLFKAVPLLEEMRKGGGVETYDGGQKLNVPLILAEHSSITQLSNGYEPVNLAVKDALRQAEFNWCDFVAPVVITRKEELSNKGPKAVVSIAEARMKSVMGLLQREVEKQLIAGTSSVLTELNTLATTKFDRTGAVQGFLAGAAFQGGSQAGTVGGIDTSVFTSFQNQFVHSSTLSIQDMTDLYIKCQAHTPGGGSPNLIISNADTYKDYKKLLFDNERYIAENQLDGGRLTLAFHGARMYYDPFLDGVQTETTVGAGKDIRAYFLNTDHLKLAFDSDAQFEMEDFEHISGYASRSANILTRLQMYVEHLSSQGLLTK